MSVVPDPEALSILIKLADFLPSRGGWARLEVLSLRSQLPIERARVMLRLSELERLGYCIPPGSGDLVYVTRTGMKVARAARQAVEAGISLDQFDVEHLARHLFGSPYAWA